MNAILSLGVMSLSVFVSVIYGQYYPHRTPVSPKPYFYNSANNANSANPFQKAYENQGYYQRFTDYGSQRGKPLTQSHNTYTNEDKGEEGKGQQSHDSYEDSEEFNFEPNLDYNELTHEDGKEFDPLKYVQDGVAGFDNYADFAGLGDVGDHFDYNVDYHSK